MRYGTETRLTSEELLDRARDYFGVSGELGLPEVSTHAGTITFCDGIGFVSVHADNIDRRTEVTILAREYDYWAKRFIRDLH
jgi:hypothetical protein